MVNLPQGTKHEEICVRSEFKITILRAVITRAGQNSQKNEPSNSKDSFTQVEVKKSGPNNYSRGGNPTLVL